jgi:hypothetical protein
MPNEIPTFLQDFMNHRKQVVKKDLTSPAVRKTESLKPAMGGAELEMGLQGIIDKTPKDKVVKEFLQVRIDELSKSKMK